MGKSAFLEVIKKYHIQIIRGLMIFITIFMILNLIIFNQCVKKYNSAVKLNKNMGEYICYPDKYVGIDIYENKVACQTDKCIIECEEYYEGLNKTPLCILSCQKVFKSLSNLQDRGVLLI